MKATSTPFFITGLPRTRTCWLANLFSTGGVLCHHDLLGQVDDETELRAALTPPEGGRVGDADSGLLFVPGWFKTEWPEAPWVCVRRPFAEAWADLVQFAKGSRWADRIPVTPEARQRLEKAYSEWALPACEADPKCLMVDFGNLDCTVELQGMARHLGLPPLDERRVALLQTLHVQPFQAKHEFQVNAELMKRLWQSAPP